MTSQLSITGWLDHLLSWFG